uniref:Uncharacterized protein n=1 Tax=Timema poppense TaxID=170557 RepID=A0A7R9CV03_TIMPO|nr:unnamed protein product [Timema poppensis]
MLVSGREALLGQKLGTNDTLEGVLLPLVEDNSQQDVSLGQTDDPSPEKPALNLPSASVSPRSGTPLAVRRTPRRPFQVLPQSIRNWSYKRPVKSAPPDFLKRLKAKQEKFQENNDLPVWLKGGPMDKVLYQLTCLLCVVGLGMTGHFIYQMSYGVLKTSSSKD